MKTVCSTDCKNSIIIEKNKKLISNFSELDKNSNFFKLLGNTTRLKILIILFSEELCVCDIADSIDLSIPATSQQLKILKQAGILNSRNMGKTIFYFYTNKKTANFIEKLITRVYS